MRLFDDLRYACRTILHNPGFALIAIVSIALGVGLNASRNRQDSRRVVAEVLSQGLGFTAVGVVVGIALALPASPFLQTFAVGASTHDPAIRLSVAAILTTVMIAACWIPAC